MRRYLDNLQIFSCVNEWFLRSDSLVDHYVDTPNKVKRFLSPKLVEGMKLEICCWCILKQRPPARHFDAEIGRGAIAPTQRDWNTFRLIQSWAVTLFVIQAKDLIIKPNFGRLHTKLDLSKTGQHLRRSNGKPSWTEHRTLNMGLHHWKPPLHNCIFFLTTTY